MYKTKLSNVFFACISLYICLLERKLSMRHEFPLRPIILHFQTNGSKLLVVIIMAYLVWRPPSHSHGAQCGLLIPTKHINPILKVEMTRCERKSMTQFFGMMLFPITSIELEIRNHYQGIKRDSL